MKSEKSRLIIKILLIALGVILASVLIFGLITNSMLSNGKVYKGISISGKSVSGLTESEIRDFVNMNFKTDLSQSLVLSCGETERVISLSELSPVLTEEAGKSAYSYARYGSYFDRVVKFIGLRENPIDIPLSVDYNEELLDSILDDITLTEGVPMEDMSSELSGDILTVKPGKAGKEINKEEAKTEIFKNIYSGEYDVELNLCDVYPTTPTPEEIHKKYARTVSDASFELVDGEIEYIDEVIGIDFTVDAVKNAIQTENQSKISFPVSVSMPKVTKAELEEKMFCDLLATYSSKYNEAVIGRSHNVKLASKNINGKILLKNDIFSYNETVGPRTAERGFKEANVYVGDEVEVGIGGGICQVSSTLFNTAVMSGLEIVTRTSHSLPVSYVPLGRDATVSYGTIDFKFSNPYDMPIKIVATASGGTNTISIYGTNENPGRKISLATELVKTIPFETTRTEDANLSEGTVKIEQNGVNGSVYNTYKVVTENGKTISSTFLTKSTYRPTIQKEIIGTNTEIVSTLGEGEMPEDDPKDVKPNEIEGEDVGLPAEVPLPDENAEAIQENVTKPTIKPVPNELQ